MKLQVAGTWIFRFLLSTVLLGLIWATWNTIEKVNDRQNQHITEDTKRMAICENNIDHHITETHKTLAEDIDEIKVDMKVQQRAVTNIEKTIIEINAKIPE